jgi:hypothetical protein
MDLDDYKSIWKGVLSVLFFYTPLSQELAISRVFLCRHHHFLFLLYRIQYINLMIKRKTDLKHLVSLTWNGYLSFTIYIESYSLRRVIQRSSCYNRVVNDFQVEKNNWNTFCRFSRDLTKIFHSNHVQIIPIVFIYPYSH